MLLSTPNPSRAGGEPARDDDSVLTRLVLRRRLFLRFLERHVASSAMAEDILQNAYLRALEHACELREGESSIAWFYRILRNAVIDFYRHRGVEDRALQQWAAELTTEVAANDLTQDVVCRCIANVLPTLPAPYATILQAVDLEEVRLTVFAADHGIKPGNATVRLHRARKALKQRLIETCGVCALHECMDCHCVG